MYTWKLYSFVNQCPPPINSILKKGHEKSLKRCIKCHESSGKDDDLWMFYPMLNVYEEFVTPTDCIIYECLHLWLGNCRLDFYVCMTKRTKNEKFDEYDL